MASFLRTALLAILSIANCIPYFWMVLTAFRLRTDITASPPKLGFRFTFENFALVYNGQYLIKLLANSFIIASGTVFLSLLIGAPAAYYFARHKSKWAKTLFLLTLATRMAPPIALSLPMFVLFTEIGLRGSYAAVMIAHTVFNMAFVVWFLEGFISGIPSEIELAAQADGRSRLGALASVILPLMKSALTTAALFVFLFSWNEYMMASLLSSSTTRPVTPALPGFIAQATSQWGSFCAVAFLSSVPALCMAVLGRKVFSRVFTSGILADDEGLAQP